MIGTRSSTSALALVMAAMAALVWELATPSAANAQRVLFLSGELPQGEAAQLRSALGESLGVSVVTPADLRSTLTSLAAELGDDPAGANARRALENAHRAYVELRLGQSSQAYERALTALTASDRTVASPEAIARILFERSLVHLAAQRRRDAEHDLRAALQVHPDIQPDRSVYGAPIQELFVRARRTRGRSFQLDVVRSPADARVLVNGRVIEPGERAEVRGVGPHLVTSVRAGYAARSMLVRAGRRSSRVRIALRQASSALRAFQALSVWPEGAAPSQDALRLAAVAAEVTQLVDAERVGSNIELVLRNADSEVVRRATGATLDWEPHAFFVLAERLAGRTVDPPEPGQGPTPVSIAVSAPEEVRPASPFLLRVTLRDPQNLTATLSAVCGDETVRAEPQRGTSELELHAPAETGSIACHVAALDARAVALVRFPSASDALLVQVVQPPSDDSAWWALGGAITATAGVVAVVLALVLYEPKQLLVLEGLD